MNLFLPSAISITKQGITYSILWLISSSLLTASSAKLSPSLIKDFSKNELQHSREPESPKITPPSGYPSPLSAVNSPSREIIEDTDQRCIQQPDVLKKVSLRYIPPVFRSCAPYIYQHSNVPIVLPAISHPKQWDRHNLENEINYPFISEVSSSQYWLSWKAKSKDISSSNSAGSALFNREYVIGEKLNSQSLSLASFHTKFKDNALKIFPIGVRRLPSGAPELGGSVALSKGIVGYYFPAMCGANCHGAFARIVWDQGNYRYTVALIMSRREEIIEMANSAINNQ